MSAFRILVSSVAAFVSFAAVLGLSGCGRSAPDDFDLGRPLGADAGFGSGGTTGTGGVFATGGSFETGGVSGAGGFATGGFFETGGVSGTGGFFETGGVSGTGGFFETGGVSGTGGFFETGGVFGTGGVVGTGGAVNGCEQSCEGCCTPSGVCEPGDGTNACGLGGVKCLDCGSSGFGCDNGTCQGTPPKCGPGNCTGCCDSLGRCRAGTETDACGVKGGVCASCTTKNEGCDNGTCAGVSPKCGPGNCGGCCTAAGACVAGTADGACGMAGDACQSCTASGSKCNEPGAYCAFIPPCSTVTCSAGCCDSKGVCQTGRADAACGTSGRTCSACDAIPSGKPGSNETCAPAGYCWSGVHCGPDNCGGCCTSTGECRQGNTTGACGLYGGLCDTCSSGETCKGGACGVPGATCPAPYAGCAPGTLTTPPTISTSCNAPDLAAVAAACTGTGPSAKCTAELRSLLTSNAGCFDCLQQFLYDGGIVKCLAPFLSPSCNAEFSCATDCLSGTCGKCVDQKACQEGVSASSGTCNSYVNGLFCAEAAEAGPGAFCDLGRINDNGLWLQGVGAYYCSK